MACLLKVYLLLMHKNFNKSTEDTIIKKSIIHLLHLL